MRGLHLVVFSMAIVACLSENERLKCEQTISNIPTDWIDMSDKCVQHTRNQIKTELGAAMQYLAMGAYFSKDSVNRPGFAKMFFESASEEREHAIKLISYLLMRGELKSDVSNLINSNFDIETVEWDSGVAALKQALKLEATVTQKIRGLIVECEDDKKFNDYHFVDYLTGDFLEEQYKGQREIAGKISTLDKLMKSHGAIGEFLFDKQLLNAQVV